MKDEIKKLFKEVREVEKKVNVIEKEKIEVEDKFFILNNLRSVLVLF